VCGIAGIWSFAGPVTAADRAAVDRMATAIAHRGPDDAGSWSDDRVAFAHRRLAIVDPTPASRQPLATAGVLVYNGEVYNHRDLRGELARDGCPVAGTGDTPVVAAALRHWGPDRAVRAFDGMFALAWYDPAAATLWLARDRLGIKSLSVARHAERLYLASEDKAVLAVPGFPRRLDVHGIVQRFAQLNPDNRSSLLMDIRRLPPGALWRVTAQGIDEATWWDAIDSLVPGRPGEGDQAATDRAEALLRASVARHTVADVPVAIALSGGVDSGLVAAFARAPRPDVTAYVVDPVGGDSEAPAAAATAARLGVPLARVPLDRAGFFAGWPRMVWHLESDGWSASRVALLVLAERCRADGNRVLLAGEGADELFGGYHWHAASGRAWRWLDPPWTWFRAARTRARSVARRRGAPFLQSLGKADGDEQERLQLALGPATGLLQARILDRLAPLPSAVDRAVIGSALFDLYTHLQDLLVRHDRIAMAAAVELRVPFLQNDLIDFAMHLPARQRQRGRTGKWLLRQVAMRHLPAANVAAPKRGFDLPATLSAGAERVVRGGLLPDVLRWSAAETDAIVARAAARTRLRMRVVGMELFLRLYLGGESPDVLTDRLLRAAAGPP
jgi:asparagine synthase (glutamine-hydrolysing)